MTLDPAALFVLLKKFYGPQGWWPIISPETGESCYSVIKKPDYNEIFEIIIGAILTQSVAWKNVEKALFNLKKSGMLDPHVLKNSPLNLIAEKIRPSGYFNQKAIKIKNFLEWFEKEDFSFELILKSKTGNIRNNLLSIKGIGPETADSILLYGFSRKIFVIDAYTKRIFSRLGLIDSASTYEDVQNYFHYSVPGSAKVFNEYHALIVAHGKDVCKKNPLCKDCCIKSFCAYSPSIQN